MQQKERDLQTLWGGGEFCFKLQHGWEVAPRKDAKIKKGNTRCYLVWGKRVYILCDIR